MASISCQIYPDGLRKQEIEVQRILQGTLAGSILNMQVLSVGHPVFVCRVLEMTSENVKLRLHVHRFFYVEGWLVNR